jgi:hypothetical protein
MIEQLIHKIKVRQSGLQVSLASGVAGTWDAYQRMVGEHQGLQMALDMIGEILDEEKGRE